MIFMAIEIKLGNNIKYTDFLTGIKPFVHKSNLSIIEETNKREIREIECIYAKNARFGPTFIDSPSCCNIFLRRKNKEGLFERGMDEIEIKNIPLYNSFTSMKLYQIGDDGSTGILLHLLDYIDEKYTITDMRWFLRESEERPMQRKIKNEIPYL
jgi:hypothetical protein